MCPLLNSYSVTYPGILLGGKSYLFTALQSLWLLSALKHQLESCTFGKQPQDSRIFSWGSLVTGATRPLAKAVFLDCKLDSRARTTPEGSCLTVPAPALHLSPVPEQSQDLQRCYAEGEGAVVSRWGDSKEANFKWGSHGPGALETRRLFRAFPA